MLVFAYSREIHDLAVKAMPGMPEDYWWVTASVFFLLALAATIDAFTETIPDTITLLGLISVTGLQGMYASWPLAARHLEPAIFIGVAVWALNEYWYKNFRQDALGMGDAKWTMLAVLGFGMIPALIAWGVGAVLGCAFLLTAQLVRQNFKSVTFAPFLFVGLCAGIWWLRFMNA